MPHSGPRPLMCAGVAEGLHIELSAFLPVIPCIDPQAKVKRVLALDGGAPSGLTWLPDLSCLALLSGGSQWSWSAEEGLSTLPPPPAGSASITSHAAFGAGEVALCSASGLDTLDIETAVATPLSLGVSGTPKLIYSLSKRRLLVVVERAGGQSVVLLDPDEGGCTELLSGLGEVRCACITAGEDALLLVLGDGVYRAPLDIAAPSCGELAALFSTAPLSASQLASDTQGNLYLGLGREVAVFDEEGDKLLSVRAPSEVRGCCFGDASLTTLYVCVGEAVWAVSANVQGVGPPSERLRSKIEKQVGAGERRHDGW